jgi:hypothetical protein
VDKKRTNSIDVRQEAAIQRLLERMPEDVAESFSDLQLIHIKTAIGARNWGQHALDLRGTLTFPFFRWHYYYVLLFGRNRRHLSHREQKISKVISAIIILTFLTGIISLGLLSLYLIKSYAGIDLFPNVSLGIWDYFRDNVLN